MRFYGARDVAVYELDSNTRKTVYGIERDGKDYVYEDVDEGYETETKRVIPNKTKYVVMFTVGESQEMLKRGATNFAIATTAMGYNEGALVCSRIQQFIRQIGYDCVSEHTSNAMVQCPGGGALSGLTENCRMSLTSMCPEHGPQMRIYKVITSLPLAPTKPIDFGIFKFCSTCKLCADACPSESIKHDTEPSWDIQGPWNKPGIKGYYYNGATCFSYWMESISGCGLCRSACPFSVKNYASIHDWVIKPLVSYTSAFNGLFVSMDKLFGYDKFPEREAEHSWWDIENPPVYCQDTTRGTLKLQ